jgi:O-antigen/teichoic acid export membrane protein
MKREFLINIIFLLGINLLIKPFYIFGIDRTVQNVVGAADYGLYLSLFNYAFILSIINDLGIQNFNNRHISQHRSLVGKYFAVLFSLKFVLSLCFLAVLLIGGFALGYSVDVPFLLLFIGVNQVLSSFALYLRTNISGLGFYRLDSVFSALDRLLLIGITGYLLWLAPFRDNFRIEWFVWAQTASLFLTSTILLLFLYPQIKGWKLRFRKLHFMALLRQSMPFALIILLMTLYTRVDVVMIQQLLEDGEQEAGIYGGAYRILDAGNMLGFLFAGLLLPMFSRLLSQKESVADLLDLSFRLLLTAALLISSACWFFQTEIATLLYWEADAYWGRVLGILMIAYIALSGTYLHGTLLTANGKLRAMNQLFVVAIVLNVIGNAILIPIYGAAGAAGMTVVTQFLAWFGQWWLVGRDMRVFISSSTLLRLFIYLLLLVGGGILLTRIVPPSVLPWHVQFLLFTVGSIGIAALLGLIPIRAMVRKM